MIKEIDFEEMKLITKFLNNFGIYSIESNTFANIVEVSILADGYFIKLDTDGEESSVYLFDIPDTRQKLVDTFSSYGFLLIPFENIPTSYQQVEEDEDEEQEEEQCDCPVCEEEEKSKEFAEFVAFVTAFSKVLNK